MFGNPVPLYQDSYYEKRTVFHSEVVGYDPGMLSIPEHPTRTGKWWLYAVGSSSNSGAGIPYSHLMRKSTTMKYLGVHGELEHQTTSKNVIRDMLGTVCTTAILKWGQDIPTTQRFDFQVAYAMDGGNLERPTRFDYKKVFPSGQWDASLRYAASSAEVTHIGGEFTVNNKFDFTKSGSKYPTEAILLTQEYNLNLEMRYFGDTLENLPDDPNDYSSNMLTFSNKIYRDSSVDYFDLSFNNLYLDKSSLTGRKIDESVYIWQGKGNFKVAGARTAVSAGKFQMTVLDDLSSGHYS